MKTSRIHVLWIVALLSVSSCKADKGEPSKNDTTPTNAKFERLDAFLTALINQANFSGSVLINYKGAKYSKGYGLIDRENGIEATPSSIYDIGSVTKQFTGAAILKLEMQGKLKVTDHIATYLENVPSDKSGITIHHLLTHSSGLPSAIGNDEEKITREPYIRKALSQKLLSAPGEKYHYSNVGYSLLAAIIEKITGKPYEVYLRENLFLPAGMEDTGYVIPDWNYKNMAVGYKNGRERGRPTEQDWGANGPYWNLVGNGGMLSSVEDMFKWHQSLLGENILSKTAKEKYYARHIEEGVGSGTYYGYGWAKFPTARGTWLTTHNGGNGIFFCDFLRYLEGEDLTIILMVNSNGPMFNNLGYQMAKTMLDDNYTPTFVVNQNTVDTSNGPQVDAELLRKLITVLTHNADDSSLASFINENFEANFKAVAPMEKHIEILKKISARIKGKNIGQIAAMGDESIISFTDADFELIVNSRNGKINGMGLED